MAGCSYIASFIAGATSSGRRQASAAAVRRLSAWPPASLAIVLAEAGAITYRSASLDEREVRQRLVLGRRVTREGAAQRVGLPLGDQHRRAGDGGERGGADEALRRLGLDHAHGVPGLRGQARQLQRLVGGDPPGDAEEHPRHAISPGSGT